MKEKDPNKIPKGKIQMKVRDFALCSFGWSLFHHSLPPFFFVLFSFRSFLASLTSFQSIEKERKKKDKG